MKPAAVETRREEEADDRWRRNPAVELVQGCSGSILCEAGSHIEGFENKVNEWPCEWHHAVGKDAEPTLLTFKYQMRRLESAASNVGSLGVLQKLCDRVTTAQHSLNQDPNLNILSNAERSPGGCQKESSARNLGKQRRVFKRLQHTT